MKAFFQKWGALLVLSLALAIVVIDTTLLNVSFSTIIKELHTNIQSMQWVITAYALMLSALTITGGRLGDIFGRKRMFIIGAVTFAVGSLLASFSTSVAMLIWGEAIIEGLGAALMLPATSSLLITCYEGRDRAIAFGVWGGVAGAASAIGPILGGYLTTNFSWRWGFRINVFVVILLVVTSFVIKESKSESKDTSLDDIGILLSSVGLLAIVFSIIESSQFGWWKAKQVFSLFNHQFPLYGGFSIVLPSLIYGIIVLVAFVIYEIIMEKRGGVPLVSMKLFRNSAFSIGVVMMAIIFLGQSGVIFSLPIFLQAVRNLDAFHTGLALLPLSISLLITSPLSALFNKYITPKHLIQIGLVINFIALCALYVALSPTSSVWALAPGLFLYGIGMGLIISQVTNMTLSSVSREEAGEASGVNNTFRQLGQTLGTAILGAVLLSTLTSNLVTGINANSTIPAAVKSNLGATLNAQISNVEFGTGAQLGSGISVSVQNEITSISHTATVAGNQKALLYAILFTFWGIIISFFIPKLDLAEEEY